MFRVDDKISMLKEELSEHPELMSQLDVSVDETSVPWSELEEIRDKAFKIKKLTEKNENRQMMRQRVLYDTEKELHAEIAKS